MENPNMLITYLGPQSYPAICQTISDYIKNAEATTIAGNEVLSKMFVAFNESATPILELKAFKTNAEAVAPHDAKLKDVIDFAAKQVKTGDLNFLINMCKEEHFQNMSRTGMPSPAQTIKDIKDEFNEPSSIIEANIKKGLFDSLESNLLMDLKSELVEDPSKNTINKDVDIVDKLNESIVNGNIAVYNPIGIKMEDVKNNRVVILTESCVMTINGETRDLCQEVNLTNLEIPMSHRKLMTALNGLRYSPVDETFELNESWDFSLSLVKGGQVHISKDGIDKAIIMKKEDVPHFLLESINLYQNTRPGFVRANYVADADNFTMLLENYNKLVKLDNVKAIKNLDNGNFIIADVNSVGKPNIIASNNGNQLFESYSEMVNVANEHLGFGVSKLFESQLVNEQNLIMANSNKMTELLESQNELNEMIAENRSLAQVAQKDSPAGDRIEEQFQQLNENLNLNLAELGKIRTAKLYS